MQFTWNGTLGQERLGGDVAIAVDPANSAIVYIAYCDVQAGAYTIHVRRSNDRGVTWSADLRTIPNAKNPALAINSASRVGFAYQRVTGTGASQRWETHLELTTNEFTTFSDNVLATVPATTPVATFLPYIGDYIHLMAVDQTFYGVFSANNTPNPANFPQGVTFLRNHDFATSRLLALDGVTEVPASIDPFFFKHSEITLTRLTHLDAIHIADADHAADPVYAVDAPHAADAFHRVHAADPVDAVDVHHPVHDAHASVAADSLHEIPGRRQGRHSRRSVPAASSARGFPRV